MFGIEEAVKEIKSYIKARTQNNKITISYGPERATVIFTNHISAIKSAGKNSNICMDNGDVYQTSYSSEELEDILAGKVAAGNNKLYTSQSTSIKREKLTVSE